MPTQDVTNKKGGGNAAIIGGSVVGAVGFVCIAALSIFLCLRILRKRGSRTKNVPSNESPGHQGTAATSHVPLFPDLLSSQSTPGYTPSFSSRPDPQWTSAIGILPLFPESSHQNQNTFEFPANTQNPSQDPHTSIISHSSRQSQNILEFPPNSLQVYEDPGASTISRPALQPSTSPPPSSFHTTDFPSSKMDTQAMEARIAVLENRIVALSGPSGVQVEGSRRGGMGEAEADPPRYDDLE